MELESGDADVGAGGEVEAVEGPASGGGDDAEEAGGVG